MVRSKACASGLPLRVLPGVWRRPRTPGPRGRGALSLLCAQFERAHAALGSVDRAPHVPGDVDVAAQRADQPARLTDMRALAEASAYHRAELRALSPVPNVDLPQQALCVDEVYAGGGGSATRLPISNLVATWSGVAAPNARFRADLACVLKRIDLRRRNVPRATST